MTNNGQMTTEAEASSYEKRKRVDEVKLSPKKLKYQEDELKNLQNDGNLGQTSSSPETIDTTNVTMALETMSFGDQENKEEVEDEDEDDFDDSDDSDDDMSDDDTDDSEEEDDDEEEEEKEAEKEDDVDADCADSKVNDSGPYRDN